LNILARLHVEHRLPYLDSDGHDQDQHGDKAELQRVGMDYLVEGRGEKLDSKKDNQKRYHHAGNIFKPGMSVRMLYILRFGGKLEADQRNG